MTSLLLPLAAAVSVLLPAAPRAVAVGDLDGDASPEIVVLLAWPRWGSAMRDVATEPGVAEYDVVPAIEERREIRAFRREGDRLLPVAQPLRVGPEILALGAGGPTEPVLALTDDGVAKLVLDRSPANTGTATIRLSPVARSHHLLSGAGVVYARFPFVREMDGRPPAEAIVPLVDGFLLVHPDGRTGRLPAPVVACENASGDVAIPLAPAHPARELLAWLPDETRFDGRRPPHLEPVAAIPVTGPLSWGPPRTWSPDELVARLATLPEERRPDAAALVRVADWDGDGTPEVAVEQRWFARSSPRELLRWARHAPARFTIHALRADGRIDPEPRWTLDATGFDYPFIESGPTSPFADLDGDGVPELVTVDLGLGWFGVGRALVTGTGRALVRCHLYRFARDGFREVPGAVPEMVGKMDVREGELRRFARWPGDLDGDGIRELVEIAEDELRVRFGRPGPRWPGRPDARIPLAGPLRRWSGIFAVDLDGRFPHELLLLEDVPGRRGARSGGEELVEPVLLQVVTVPRREDGR